MKVLKTYIHSHEAHLDLAKLQDEGINAQIRDDNIVTINPLYAQAVGGIKLLVNDDDYYNAVKILKENLYETLVSKFPDEMIEEQHKCPKCKSINIYQKRSWLLASIFLIFFFLPITIRKSSFYCMDCSNHWKE